MPKESKTGWALQNKVTMHVDCLKQHGTEKVPRTVRSMKENDSGRGVQDA